MSTTTVKISQLTLGVAAADVVVPGSLADGSATRRFTLGSVVGLPHTHAVAQVTGLQAELDGKASLAATNVSRVLSLNGITGAMSIAAGSNVTVLASGTAVTISATGGGGGSVDSVNGQTGTVTLQADDVSAASSTHTHTASQITDFETEAAKYGPVVSVAGITGTVSIVAGDNVTVSTSGSSITISAAGGGGGGGGGSENAVTSVSITASANDYALPEADIYRLENPTTNTITLSGLATAAAFAPKLLVNVSTGASSTLTLLHQNTNSTAVNRFVNALGTDYSIPRDAAALVLYDSTTERWRII
jgi:hypothetical protein